MATVALLIAVVVSAGLSVASLSVAATRAAAEAGPTGPTGRVGTPGQVGATGASSSVTGPTGRFFSPDIRWSLSGFGTHNTNENFVFSTTWYNTAATSGFGTLNTTTGEFTAAVTGLYEFSLFVNVSAPSGEKLTCGFFFTPQIIGRMLATVVGATSGNVGLSHTSGPVWMSAGDNMRITAVNTVAMPYEVTYCGALIRT